METQTNSLQNFASSLNLIVHKFYPEDARKKMQWYLCKDGVSISPKLDYDGMNSFMLGYKSALSTK